MYDDSWHDETAKTVRILQVMVAAMFAGSLFFLLIAVNLAAQGKHDLSLPVSLNVIACALVGAGLIARAVVLSSVVSKARREVVSGTHTPGGPRLRIGLYPSAGDGRHDAKCLLSAFQNKTIISGALFEGWAFLATIAFWIEGNPISLGLAVLLILGVAPCISRPNRELSLGSSGNWRHWSRRRICDEAR